MAGILSKGIKISYDSGMESWKEITNLQEVPDLGGAADKVDVTTLADGNYKYINGIKDFGDMEFKFLYDNSTEESNYRVVRGLEEAGEAKKFKVEFPDTTAFEFSGEVSTKIDSVGVNAPLTFTMNVTLNSDITVSNPV